LHGTFVTGILDPVTVVVRIRTAIPVLEAVFVLRLHRTFVTGILDSVAVVVRVRAAVLVLDAVGVLRPIWGRVFVVGAPVAVLVADGVGAAVFVFATELLGRLVRTAVVRIGDEVVVVVGIEAPVRVLEPVEVLRQ